MFKHGMLALKDPVKGEFQILKKKNFNVIKSTRKRILVNEKNGGC